MMGEATQAFVPESVGETPDEEQSQEPPGQSADTRKVGEVAPTRQYAHAGRIKVQG